MDILIAQVLVLKREISEGCPCISKVELQPIDFIIFISVMSPLWYFIVPLVYKLIK